MIVYKVVRRASHQTEEAIWKSAIMTQAGCVQYVVGEWTQAPDWLREFGYHLLAFRTISDVRNFCIEDDLHVFKSKARVMPIFPAPRNIWSVEDGKLSELSSCACACAWPTGTVMCRRIKLLEEIEI